MTTNENKPVIGDQIDSDFIESAADEIELVAAPTFEPKIEASEALMGDMGDRKSVV